MNNSCAILVCLLLGLQNSAAQEPQYTPESVTYIQTEHFENPVLVWLPKNYDASKQWPVMAYYHGTNGAPTVEYLRLYSGGNDWVLIGMTYQKPGQFQFSGENLATERAILDEVLATVSKNVPIDKNRIYVSGFSKGGWVAGLFLKTDPTLAGGMILGAGTFTEGMTDHPKKLYIGIGEDDPNLAMSFRARREFGVNKATEITFEIWPEIGHKFPMNGLDPASEPMQQWMQVQAGVADQGDAIEWMEGKLGTIGKSESLSAFQKLEQIERMEASPFAGLLDKEGKEALAEAITDLKTLPETQAEQKARSAFLKVIEYESRDRFISTLAECAAGYSRIVTAHPDTVYGKRAKAAMERIAQTLEQGN